ncbi:hypothetical protein ACG7TL_006521 [Trametes sanguinea]
MSAVITSPQLNPGYGARMRTHQFIEDSSDVQDSKKPKGRQPSAESARGNLGSASDTWLRNTPKFFMNLRLVKSLFDIALKAVYNSDMHSLADPRLSVIEDLFVGIREVTASMQLLLDFFPSLQYLPAWTPVIGKFLKKLSASKAPNYHLIETEYADAKARVEESGAIDHSVVSHLLQRLGEVRNREADLIDEEVQIAKGVAGIAVEVRVYDRKLIYAGHATKLTFSTTEGFFVAMALHPEVQRKAQAELDTVVGPQRLPDFGDRDSLVYINAIVKESLRWHNVVPLGVAHKTIEDAELRGYFIPRETMVVPNVWACMHDHRYYAEPERFNPDRFIRDGRLHADVLDPSDFVFGFGRR